MGLKDVEIGMDVEKYSDETEDEMYVITPSYLLYSILKDDYDIKVGKWLPTIWEHIFQEFMEGLEKSGYLVRQSDDAV